MPSLHGGRRGREGREREWGREGGREEEEGRRVERVCKQCVSVTVKIYVHCDIHVCRHVQCISSYLSCSDIPASLALGLVDCIICSYSSAAKRLGTSPELSILLISSRNSSITICRGGREGRRIRKNDCHWLEERRRKRRRNGLSHLCISKQEDSVFSFHSSHFIQLLQVFMKSFIIVTSSQLNLQ